jgi:hypothetical protein
MNGGEPDGAPAASVLASSAALRVAVALALSGALWLGVIWASGT